MIIQSRRIKLCQEKFASQDQSKETNNFFDVNNVNDVNNVLHIRSYSI